MNTWDKLSMAEKADIMRLAVQGGVYDLDAIRSGYNEFAKGGTIHIKPENRGKFTRLKERTGHSASWFKEHGTPAQKKMATFALNAMKWKHGLGGNLFSGEENHSQQVQIAPVDATMVKSIPYITPIKPELSNEAALQRATKVYSNYGQAIDNPLSSEKETFRNTMRWLKDNVWEGIPAGVSNCTLTASQWINPAMPIKNAFSIVNSPKEYNYTQISEEDAVPGNLIIAKVPGKDSYHTMLISDYADKDGSYDFDGKKYKVKKGEPLVTYSRGGHDNSFIRNNVPLSVYTANSDGHTEKRYYRHNYPNNVFLDEIVVKPRRR